MIHLKHPFPVNGELVRVNFDQKKLEDFVKEVFPTLPKLVTYDIASCWLMWGLPGGDGSLAEETMLSEKLVNQLELSEEEKKYLSTLGCSIFSAMHDNIFIAESLEDLFSEELFGKKVESTNDLILVMDDFIFELCENIDYYKNDLPDRFNENDKDYVVVVIQDRTIYLPIKAQWFPNDIVMYLEDNSTLYLDGGSG